ncbi:hypothetical protein Riv7116_4577 [Rivularia sp. PCC 7116]|uniref:hypothetical protein n=1 Tax=Rivularia sp. PCC 7116 TaxID=373994 RepID=UPI00029ED35D|nr:hypothetical protein [Rivularia sp. PCC 7116]AFY56996.1 hypothetical protein Riv7116_4577 [Rivularia sp. PCC 7116]
MPIALIFIIIAIILTLLVHKKRNGGSNRYHARTSDRGCKALRRKLLNLVHHNTADRLINSAKRQHPGKSERWYLEKVIYDLQRGR